MIRIGLALGCLCLLGGALVADNVSAPALAGEWLPLAPQSLEVEKGSPLDFSALVPAQPAGSDGPLTLSADGRFHLRARTDPRFNCGMIANGPNQSWAMPTHAEADALATQMRRHGYNLVRFHFMDGRLRLGAPAGQGVNPENLDRYQYLLAVLKRNGIYWMLDILTSPDGDRANGNAPFHSVNDMKTRVNFDAAARADWTRMMQQVYARENPYTGLSPLADPALAFVVGANENSIAFGAQLSRNGPYPTDLPRRFDQWLRARNATPAALTAALPDLTPDEKAGKSPIAPPPGWTAIGPRATLFRAFISSLEVETYHWMTDALRGQGYRGPLLAYPEWYPGIDNRTRAALPITDLHAYIGEVSSYARGTPLKLASMTDDDGLNDWLANAAGRWLDRPLLLSEYGSPFPNPDRRDSGLLFPAVSAFQGYSAICRMANMPVEPSIPVDGPKAKPIMPYSVGIDPIARVAETLSTMIFYRRDVAQASGPGVAIPFGSAEMANANAAFIPRPVKLAALLVKFGLVPPAKMDMLPSGTQIIPISAPPQGLMNKAVDRLISMATGDVQQRKETLVSSLFARGLLPQDNRTSVARGIYQSQTGETTLDQPNGLITISTPCTQAINSLSPPTKPVALRDLSLTSLSDGALVAATSLDGKPLRDSGRILLMLAGDARNTGLSIAGGGRNRTLIDWGKLPILLQRVVAKVALRSATRFTGRFSVLALNGKPMLSRVVASDESGTIALTLDTAAIRAAPTTYFLLERDAETIADSASRKMAKAGKAKG